MYYEIKLVQVYSLQSVPVSHTGLFNFLLAIQSKEYRKGNSEVFHH